MLFGKKKNKARSPTAELILSRHGREIQYMTRRGATAADETIIGKDGVINIVENELVISCGNDIVFRAPIDALQAYELMNLSGINLVFNGISYVAYYTKGIENK